MITISKKLKQSEKLTFICNKLEAAIKSGDSFAVQVLVSRLLGMGYKLEVQGDENN